MQPQGLLFENIVHPIQLQIIRENTQQGAFTPIRYGKQPYWCKACHCAFVHRVARCEKQLSQRKQNLISCLQKILYQFTPFLNNVRIFELFCSFKVGCLAPGFSFCNYSEVLTSELSVEKHDQGVESDDWLVLNVLLVFHIYSNE